MWSQLRPDAGGWVKVTGLLREDGRVVGATYRDADGNERRVRARYVVDAGGHRSNLYKEVGGEYASHRTVKHSAKEYARREGDEVVHSNTIENVFSIFKRGMIGVYQHCGEAHLHRYLAEFDFRYNRRAALKVSDVERAAMLLAGARGKRLTYESTGQASNA